MEFFGDEDRISFGTYANFESGKTWPHSGNLRVIEELLGWKRGIIDDVLVGDTAATALTLSHMHGGPVEDGQRLSIQDFSNAEFFADLPRRVKEIEDLVHKLETYTLAASDNLGGIAPDQIEDH